MTLDDQNVTSGSPPQGHRPSDEGADSRNGQHVVTIEDIAEDDKKDLEETSM